MSIVLVDNNASALSLLSKEIAKMFPKYTIQSFADPLMSAKYICNNEVELAFLAVDMRPVDGFILLHALRANKPLLPIVMLLSNDKQREIALCELTNGYLVKPVSTKLLEDSIKQVFCNKMQYFKNA